MKKIKFLAAGIFALSIAICSNINAATIDDVVACLGKSYTVAGQQVTLSKEYQVQAERILRSSNLSSSDADKIIADANSAIAMMNAAGTADPSKLSTADQQKLIAILNDAGSVVGVNVTYNSTKGSLDFVKDGKLIAEITKSNKLAFTGTDVTPYVVVATILVLAVAVCIVDKKGLLKSEK